MGDFFKIDDLMLLKDPKFLRILGFTLYQALLSSFFALLVSILPAIYIYRKKNFLSNILENAIFIPFFFPPVSMVIAFSLIFSSQGILSKLGLNLNVMYTLNAIIIAHVFYNSPIFVKYLGSALKYINPSVEEASKMDGAGKIRRFFSLELPLIIPSFVKAFFLVFTYSFMSFAIVLNLGGIRFSTIEVSIANALRGSFNFSKALTYALAQFTILFLLNYFLSKTSSKIYTTEYPSNSKEKTSWVTSTSAILYSIFEYGIVFVGLSGIIYDFHDHRFSLTHFSNLFSTELNRKFHIIQSIINSISIATITGIFTVFISYLILKLSSKLTDIVILPILGISSAFLAMALLYVNILYNVPFSILIVAGYILIAVPIAYSFLFHAVKGLRKDVLEASELDGANSIKRFIHIECPMLLPTFLSVFFQIFAIIYGEFTISYTMQIRDYFPLTSVVNYAMSSQRYYLESSAFASFNTIIVFVFFILSTKIMSSRKNF